MSDGRDLKVAAVLSAALEWDRVRAAEHNTTSKGYAPRASVLRAEAALRAAVQAYREEIADGKA